MNPQIEDVTKEDGGHNYREGTGQQSSVTEPMKTIMQQNSEAVEEMLTSTIPG